MAGEQSADDIKALTAWLEADDAKSRGMRATRLRDLLDILPVPSDRLSCLGGEQSVICFEEIRRCYLDRSDMAVVLLCLAYVERALAAQLYAAGWARRSAVGARVAHLRRPGPSEKLQRPLPRAREFGHGSRRQGERSRHRGPREGREMASVISLSGR